MRKAMVRTPGSAERRIRPGLRRARAQLQPARAPGLVNALFGTLWKELGGTYAGTVRDETMDPGARLIATAKSPSLSEVVRDINKYSNNVMARQLFLTLGGVAGGAPRLWRRRATPSRPGLRRNS